MRKFSNLRKMSTFNVSPPPPPPPIVYIWYHIFAGPKWNFEKTKRIYFVIVTVVIWTLSWKHEQLWCENFSCNTAGGSQFLTNFHNPDQIAQFWPKFTLITKFHNSDQNSQFWSVWCGGLETAYQYRKKCVIARHYQPPTPLWKATPALPLPKNGPKDMCNVLQLALL